MTVPLLTDKDVAKRWGCSRKTPGRRWKEGKLPWIDIAGKNAKKPMPRFRLADVISYEEKNLLDVNKEK